MSATSAPDLITPVVGFRKWRLREGELSSPYVHVPWSDPVAHAGCHRSELTGFVFGQDWLEEPHRSPDPRCKCGIYAYHEPRTRSKMTYLRSVWGIVTLWGRIEVHRDGMRAEHARIVALAVAAEWTARQRRALGPVAERLGAALVEHHELEAAARDYGAPLPAGMKPPPAAPARGWAG